MLSVCGWHLWLVPSPPGLAGQCGPSLRPFRERWGTRLSTTNIPNLQKRSPGATSASSISVSSTENMYQVSSMVHRWYICFHVTLEAKAKSRHRTLWPEDKLATNFSTASVPFSGIWGMTISPKMRCRGPGDKVPRSGEGDLGKVRYFGRQSPRKWCRRSWKSPLLWEKLNIGCKKDFL